MLLPIGSSELCCQDRSVVPILMRQSCQLGFRSRQLAGPYGIERFAVPESIAGTAPEMIFWALATSEIQHPGHLGNQVGLRTLTQ